MKEPPWYRGSGNRQRPEQPVKVPISLLERHTDPSGYIADEGLADAVNVALHLGQPLLLTGQPGTGKTQLAYSLAWELGYDFPPLKFETKSTSVSRDLFYTYDAVGRFYAAQTGEGSAKAIDYIKFKALGLAILYANPLDKVKHLLTESTKHHNPRRSVVLIDEIDKAPRDFPNDLLNEVEGMHFQIPELSNETVKAQPDLRPVLVLTSNSEKNLPEAFLRRCVFYHIPFPEENRLKEIVHLRLGESIVNEPEVLKDALEIFDKLRDRQSSLVKRPSTGELLAWLRVLTGASTGRKISLRDPEMIEPTLASLIKTAWDRGRAKELLQEWLQGKQS